MSHSNASVVTISKSSAHFAPESKHRRVKSSNDFDFLKFKNPELTSSVANNDFLFYPSQTAGVGGFYPKRTATEEMTNSPESK